MPFEAISSPYNIRIIFLKCHLHCTLKENYLEATPNGLLARLVERRYGSAPLEPESQPNMLQDFAKLLDAKLEQKYWSFKRSFEEKEEQRTTKIKKLKFVAKASSSFKYRGNRVQYEFNTSILYHVESCRVAHGRRISVRRIG